MWILWDCIVCLSFGLLVVLVFRLVSLVVGGVYELVAWFSFVEYLF